MPNERILVVEDERITAEDIRRRLLKMGYSVISTVDTGEKAIKEASDQKPDLILMDIILKGKMDGIEAAGQIHSRLNIPIVFLTAFTDEKILERAKATSPFGYIVKPFQDRDLHITIEIALYKSKIDKELRESKELFHTTLKSIGDAVIVMDQNSNIVFMNQVSQRLTGWDLKDASGKPIQEIYKIFNEVIGDRSESPLIRAMNTRIILETANQFTSDQATIDQSTLINKYGTMVPVEERCDMIIDDHGDVMGSVLVFSDISERIQIKKEQQERAQTQAFINKILQISLNDISLKEILEQILDHLITIPWIEFSLKGGIWVVEDEPDVLVLAAQRRLHNLQTICGRIPFGKCVCGRCASTGEIQYTDHVDEKHEVKYKNMSPHGNYCIPLVSSGKVIGIINLYLKEGRLRNLKEEELLKTIANVVAGIIQRKKTETELKRSNDFMSTVLNSINDAICIIDVQDQKILGFNSAFQKESGLEEKKIIGEHCYKITHNNTQACKPPDCVCALSETLRTGKHAVVEHLHYGADGKKIYLEVSTSPVRNETGRIIKVVHSTRNTTERKLVEEHLKQVNIELKRADELKTQFLSVISHELRTPLTPMNAQLQMMLAGYFGEITEKQRKSLDMTLKNTGRLDRLIGDVLDISKLESGVMKFNMLPASMNEIVENAVETMKIQALNKNMKITLKEDKIPLITIDKDRITQAILNLIHNAIKFTDAGGVIEVELSCDVQNVMVKVKDTGIGIRTEDINKLFKPFQQLDSSYGRKYEGSGLGLVICNRIIMKHGGKIWVESEFGKGSTFIFSIPLIHEVKEEKVESIMLEDKKE
ncbi:MAG: ATP-binding protein [Candidatus Methanoperedens sp.]|nr:ATP-binding protein [Candidatus Methanoperedens sp.]